MDSATYCGRSLDKGRQNSATGTPSAPQTAPKEDGSLRDKLGPGPGYQIPTGGQQSPVPTDPGGQVAPGGDILAQIMRELAKAIEEGRLKPVVVGPDRDRHSWTGRTCWSNPNTDGRHLRSNPA